MTPIAGRYTLGEVIGTGGMSEVYAAYDDLLGRDVAIKILRLELARDVSFRERFRREAQNSGKLNHPSIVAVYDTGETMIDDISVPYIVMERVMGRTLREILHDDGALAPTTAAAMLLPVCEALQASHDAQIIHRDIKPANIMVTNTGAVKVMDFGIARALDDSTSAMTQTSAVIGTAQYLSPEQARGKTADARSDVYALGCVLYEMLTLRPPFEGETPFAVAYQHVQEDPEPPSSYIADLTPTQAINVDAVVLTAMAKHPADRYQSAEEMGRDLRLLSNNAVTRAARTYVSARQAEGAAGESGAAAGYGAGAGAGAGVGGSAAGTGVTQATMFDGGAGAGAGGFDAGGFGGAGEGPATPPALPVAPRRRAARPVSQQTQIMRWLVALLSIVVVGVGGAFIYDSVVNPEGGFSHASGTVKVPDVAKMPEDQAQRTLHKAGLEVEVTHEPSPDVARGIALRTNPVAGSTLQDGTTVTLVVSSGREDTQVPDLKDKTLQEARDALQAAGLKLSSEVKEEKSEDVEEGKVISQTPEKDRKVAKGDEVHVIVSLGSGKVRVPDLTGVRLSEAQSTLESLGFEVHVDPADSRLPANTVISLSDSGTQQEKGSVITLVVSSGNLVAMPNLTGMSYNAAVAALQEAGWYGQLVEGEPVKTALITDNQKVAATSPAGGHDLRVDQPVTIRLWTFDLSALTG